MMGSALLQSWLKHDHLFSKVIVVTPHQESVTPFQDADRVCWFAHPGEVDLHPDIILFAVKPQVLPQIISLYQRFLTHNPLFLTVVAGFARAFYEHALPHVSLIRIMPNLPVRVHKGMSALCANAAATPAQQQQCESLMQQVGRVIWVENDEQIDVVTAVAGCGPAYVYLLAEALEKGAEHLGLDTEKAALLARQTIIGAASYLEATDQSVHSLRQQVTSPGGMTEAAVAILQQNRQFDIMFKEALNAAMIRAKQLQERT
jgi:pyrroline-5-carboxylate reductase